MAKNKSLLEMADRVGSFIEYWGFKQIHGKIWTLMFLSSTPVDANYLKDTLKISKALTSMSLKDLLEYNVIFEVEKDKPGTQKYRINPDITQVILDVIKNRELKMLDELQEKFKSLSAEKSNYSSENLKDSRLDELGTMVDTAKLLLMGMVGGQSVDFLEFGKSTGLTDD